jgi:hypothetical protein
VDERAGDEGVEADAEREREREGEEERFHQRIGAYGDSETLVIMKWVEMASRGRRGDRWDGRRRPPLAPRHLGFFSFSLGVLGLGVGRFFFWEESGSASACVCGTRLWGKKSSESMPPLYCTRLPLSFICAVISCPLPPCEQRIMMAQGCSTASVQGSNSS